MIVVTDTGRHRAMSGARPARPTMPLYAGRRTHRGRWVRMSTLLWCSAVSSAMSSGVAYLFF